MSQFRVDVLTPTGPVAVAILKDYDTALERFRVISNNNDRITRLVRVDETIIVTDVKEDDE